MAWEYESHSHAFAAHIKKKKGKEEKKRWDTRFFSEKIRGRARRAGLIKKTNTRTHIQSKGISSRSPTLLRVALIHPASIWN